MTQNRFFTFISLLLVLRCHTLNTISSCIMMFLSVMNYSHKGGPIKIIMQFLVPPQSSQCCRKIVHLFMMLLTQISTLYCQLYTVYTVPLQLHSANATFLLLNGCCKTACCVTLAVCSYMSHVTCPLTASTYTNSIHTMTNLFRIHSLSK